MKNLIFIVLFSACLFFSACSSKNEELIELNRANSQNAPAPNENVLTVETIDVDKSAGDEVCSQPIVVYICGSVQNPGVYELDSGSRIIDAVEMAGGLTDNAYERYLNLAKVITDEQMIYVPTAEEYEEMVSGAGEADGGSDGGLGVTGSDGGLGVTGSGGGLVNINNATAEQLMTIPGIGQSKAEKIINYRNENGGFRTCEDIMQISGIKEGMYNKIKDYICVK